VNLPEIIQSLESGNFNCWVTATIRDLKECEAENERLKAINAELLAAMKTINADIQLVKRPTESGVRVGLSDEQIEALEAAIANAQPQGNR